jgi:hypothetical protein
MVSVRRCVRSTSTSVKASKPEASTTLRSRSRLGVVGPRVRVTPSPTPSLTVCVVCYEPAECVDTQSAGTGCAHPPQVCRPCLVRVENKKCPVCRAPLDRVVPPENKKRQTERTRAQVQEQINEDEQLARQLSVFGSPYDLVSGEDGFTEEESVPERLRTGTETDDDDDQSDDDVQIVQVQAAAPEHRAYGSRWVSSVSSVWAERVVENTQEPQSHRVQVTAQATRSRRTRTTTQVSRFSVSVVLD